MTSIDDMNRATANEWRKLGFFYDLRDDLKTWLIIGSRQGLLRFRDLLLEYIEDPANEAISEHAHYGPYMYLKVTTWQHADIVSDGIRGPLPALRRLADRIGEAINSASVGDTISAAAWFAPNTTYGLELVVREPGFDPATADESLHR